MQSSWIPLRLPLALAVVAAWMAASVAGQLASDGSAQAGPTCSAQCQDLRTLPLGQWSGQRSQPELSVFPWHAGYAFQPLDFAALAEEVCACLALAGGEQAPGQKCPSCCALWLLPAASSLLRSSDADHPHCR